MSDAYDDDIAAERGIFARIAAAEDQAGDAPPPFDYGGRPHKADPIKLVAWRQAHGASIAETAKRWSVSEATVKRLCRDYGEAAKLERKRWEQEQLDRELRQHEHGYAMMYLGQRNRHLSWVDLEWSGRCDRARGTAQEAVTEAAREAALNEAGRRFQEDWGRHMGPVPEFAVPDRGGSKPAKLPE